MDHESNQPASDATNEKRRKRKRKQKRKAEKVSQNDDTVVSWHGLLCPKAAIAFSALAIAILSVRLSVTQVDQSKTVQYRIVKSSPSAAWKTIVSGIVKLFHKFKGGHTERGH